ncbi:MAG: acyl-CoA dehydrogenase family protein [Haloechinothrix sp.]
MDFSLDENQRAVAELAAEVLRKECDGAQDELDPEPGHAEPVWAAMAKVGLLSLAVPVDLGGDGLGVSEVAVVLREVGARGARVPALATLALGVLPVSAHGTEVQQAALLPDVATGTALLTGAPSEPASPFADRLRTTATRTADGWALDGVKTGVPCAAQASRILVPATVSGGSAVFLVGPRADGVTLLRTPTATGSPEYTVTLDRAIVPDESVLGGDTSGAVVRSVRDFGRAGAAALGDGAVAGALELTTAHVRTRHQFGKPLATFQAVAQQIADVYIASRTVHLAATTACWRLGVGLDAAEDLDLAAYWLTAEAPPALRTCHHLHGGLGVDVTYPLHRYYSTVKDLARFLGGAGSRLEALSVSVGS